MSIQSTTISTLLTLFTSLLLGCGPGEIETEEEATETEEAEEAEEAEEREQPCAPGSLMCTSETCLCNVNVEGLRQTFSDEELQAFISEGLNGTLDGTCEGVLEESACLFDPSELGLVSFNADLHAQAKDFGSYTCAICANRGEKLDSQDFPLASPYPGGIGGACGRADLLEGDWPNLTSTFMVDDPNGWSHPDEGPNPYCLWEDGDLLTGDLYEAFVTEDSTTFGGKVCTGFITGCSWMCSHDGECGALMGLFAFEVGKTAFCGLPPLDSMGVPTFCGLH